MRRFLILIGVFVICLFIFKNQLISLITGIPTNCLDGIDSKKIGLIKSSISLNESMQNSVFEFRLNPDKQYLKVNENFSINLKEIWIERAWSYECVNSDLVIDPKNFYHLLIKTDNYDSAVSNLRSISIGGQLAGGHSGVLGFTVNLSSTLFEIVSKNYKGSEIDKVILRKE